MGSMKVHQQLGRGFWEHEPSSLSLGFKRLRPLAPKLHTCTTTTNTTSSSPHHFDLKNFIRPESGPIKIPNSTSNHVTNNKDSPSPHLQVETHPGGTRWNPTQEQIGILEMLYRGGMRTPNAQQIEHITAQLGKYGKIEGKNVFYWFQNHKARERQKQKRNNTILLHSNNSPPPPPTTTTTTTTTTNHNNSSIFTTTFMSSSSTISTNLTFHTHQEDLHDFNPLRKKKCIRTWEFEQQSASSSRDDTTTTLELFPLHPESK